MKTGRIYKIISTQGTECYVGSTFNTTRDRFKSHKDGYVHYQRGKGNRASVYDLFDRYGIKGCKIILIKEYEVIDRKHLEVYETLWIKKLRAINKVDPSGGLLRREQRRQYRQDNKENIQIQNKIYNRVNKERRAEKYEESKHIINEKRREKLTCECGSIVRSDGIREHKRSNKHKNFCQKMSVVI